MNFFRKKPEKKYCIKIILSSGAIQYFQSNCQSTRDRCYIDLMCYVKNLKKPDGYEFGFWVDSGKIDLVIKYEES